MTDDGSVRRAVADVEAHEGRIDTLINNAGIIGARVAASELTGDDALLVFETNVISVVRVTNAFLPLLKRSDAPAVINVSSGMGSFALTHDPDRVESTIASPLYTASKAAVTMMTTQYAKAIPEHPVQRRRPRLHRHRPQRAQRPPDRQRGHRRDRRPRDRGRVGRDRPVRGPLRARSPGSVSRSVGPRAAARSAPWPRRSRPSARSRARQAAVRGSRRPPAGHRPGRSPRSPPGR